MVNDNSKYFVFNGKKSSDFGVWCSGFAIFETPAKRYEQIDVPGRNGALIIEDGSYENVEIEFKDCFIPYDFPTNFSNLKNWLYRQKGYNRLELSWLPDEYRLAAFEGDISPTIKNWDGMGKFDLVFNCKPQRFLKSGEEPILVIPPNFTSTHMYTPVYAGETTPVMYAYAYEGVTFGSLTFKMHYFDAGDEVDTYTETITRPWMLTPYTEYHFDHWQAEIDFGENDADDYFFTMDINQEMQTDFDNTGTAIWARTIKIENPTGFVCKPLIHSLGASVQLQDVILSDGEGWSISCADYSTITTSTYIDCENEYFYYIDDGKKVNLTDYMTITHTDGDGNDLPTSFPAFGEGETTLYVYVMGSGEGTFLEIFPHWYTI